jgi:4-hydroxybenzoate polyprenyltransferase
MTTGAVERTSPATLLRLGRISNLPTVWTNVLAGAVLSGGERRSWRLGLILLAMSLFYVGGMYLNDYFDRAIDARERPERPIPAGAISPGAVAAIGFGLLGAGLLAAALAGWTAAGLAALLGAAVIAYDLHHKGNPRAPVVMGLCRALVYCAAAAAVSGGVALPVVAAAAAMGAYVAALTYAARQESLDKVGNLWPLLLLAAPMVLALGAVQHGVSAIAIYLLPVAATAFAVYLLAKRPGAGAVSRAVALLIAAISLADAAMLVGFGALGPALAAVVGFPATLTAQKYIAGT